MCQGKGIKLADGVLMGDYPPRMGKRGRGVKKYAALLAVLRIICYAAMPNKAVNSGRGDMREADMKCKVAA